MKEEWLDGQKLGGREEQMEAGAGKSTGLSSAEFYLFIFLFILPALSVTEIPKWMHRCVCFHYF